MSDLLAKLNKALKPGASAPAGTLIHENEKAILDTATQLLSKSETGRELLDFARENGVKMHVLRNKQDIGFLPEESTVYISCPAGTQMPPLRAVIYLAGALRQAMQETIDPLKRPKTAKIPTEEFVKVYVGKQKDALFYQTAVVYELAKVNGLSEIIDEYTHMGYLSLYEAYQKDMKQEGLE